MKTLLIILSLALISCSINSDCSSYVYRYTGILSPESQNIMVLDLEHTATDMDILTAVMLLRNAGVRTIGLMMRQEINDSTISELIDNDVVLSSSVINPKSPYYTNSALTNIEYYVDEKYRIVIDRKSNKQHFVNSYMARYKGGLVEYMQEEPISFSRPQSLISVAPLRVIKNWRDEDLKIFRNKGVIITSLATGNLKNYEVPAKCPETIEMNEVFLTVNAIYNKLDPDSLRDSR